MIKTSLKYVLFASFGVGLGIACALIVSFALIGEPEVETAPDPYAGYIGQ